MGKFKIVVRYGFAFGTALILTSCAAPRDTEHHIVVSVRDQKLALLQKGNLVATYPISTSKFGLSDRPGSYGTPNAFRRDIYIHGTPEERNIGRPASYGCIRMRSVDIINLYSQVGPGAQVSIIQSPLVAVIPELNSASQMAETNHALGVIR